MDEWINDINDIEFESHGPVRRALKTMVINPLVNYMPAGLTKGLLKLAKSELAHANWNDPGGWRSMVISYEGKPGQVADKILVGGGSVPTALRNRKRLGAAVLTKLIEQNDGESAHILCLGAGPGITIIEALKSTESPAHATLVDISNDAFDYGQQLADRHGVGDRVRYVLGDVRDIDELLAEPPAIVTMIGICEYLTDEQIVEIITAAASVMPPGAAIVFNSISKKHGTDRFFRRVFGLHMNHRSPLELQALMGQAGFANFTAIPEPLGVYHMIVGRRLP